MRSGGVFSFFIKVSFLVRLVSSGIYQYKPMHTVPQRSNLVKIPKNIPIDATEIIIKQHNIDTIETESFKNLIMCVSLDLTFNNIHTIEPRAFVGMKKLEKLCLYSNKISQFHAFTFEGLTSLKTLFVADNKIKHIDPNAFHSLKSLLHLYLSKNVLKQFVNSTLAPVRSLLTLFLERNQEFVFTDQTFSDLANLSVLIISRGSFQCSRSDNACAKLPKHESILKNSLKKLTKLTSLQIMNYGKIALKANSFSRNGNLKIIFLRCNFITDIPQGTFSGLNNLIELFLDYNCLNILKNYTVYGLSRLHKLSLGFNQISHIDRFAFKTNKNLREISLYNNKLTYLQENIFGGLHLTSLSLFGNRIHSIEPGTFSGIWQGTLGLNNNRLTSLLWNIFVNKKGKNEDRKNVFFELHLDTSLACKKHTCWIFEGIDAGWIKPYKSVPPKECRAQCESKDKCMEEDESIMCSNSCAVNGYADGLLQLDYYVCPFKYYCKCICPPFDKAKCEKNCNKEDKIPINNSTDDLGCASCECQCPNENCAQKYIGQSYEIFNKSGCARCKCLKDSLATNNKSKKNNTEINATGQTTNSEADEGTDKRNDTIRTVLVSVVSVTGSLTLSCLFCLILRNLKRLFKRAQHTREELAKNEETPLEVLSNLNPELSEKIKDCWIEPKKIIVNRLIGSGNFGIVWAGTFHKVETRNIPVAVKKSRDDLHSAKETIDFVNESLIMRRFNHPNVLRLIGVSVLNDSPCAVLPLMTNGDLKTYLRTNYSTLTIPNLLAFLLGVAKGMKHLSEQNLVHRDLAARNCLLNNKLVVKISDFGLARDMHDSDYYRIGDTNKGLPVRWMSLEAIQDRIFTTQSDVWSYGVVLWEIFTKGILPYTDVQNADIEDYLKKGKRLQKPELAPDYMYNIMLKCWNLMPSERPNFNDILTELDFHVEAEAQYVALIEPLDDTKMI